MMYPAQRAARETSPGQRAVARSHLHVLVRVHLRVQLIQGSCVFACYLSPGAQASNFEIKNKWPDCAQARCLPVGSRRKLPGRPGYHGGPVGRAALRLECFP